MSSHLLPASRFLSLLPRISSSRHSITPLSHLPLLPPLSSPPYQQVQLSVAVTSLIAYFRVGSSSTLSVHTLPILPNILLLEAPGHPSLSCLHDFALAVPCQEFSLPFLHLSPLPGSNEGKCFTRLQETPDILCVPPGPCVHPEGGTLSPSRSGCQLNEAYASTRSWHLAQGWHRGGLFVELNPQHHFIFPLFLGKGCHSELILRGSKVHRQGARRVTSNPHSPLLVAVSCWTTNSNPCLCLSGMSWGKGHSQIGRKFRTFFGIMDYSHPPFFLSCLKVLQTPNQSLSLPSLPVL